MKKSIFKKIGGLFLGLAMGLGVAVGVTAGNKTSEVKAAGDTTYTFNSKSWGSNATGNDVWSSGKDGGQFTANQGIQVTKSGSGAYGTSGKSFSNVSKVVVNYCTNAKAGAGAIKVAVGTTEKSYSVTAPSSGGTTRRDTDELVFSPAASGKVKITVDCTTNSIYIWSVTITEEDSSSPLDKPTGLSASQVGSDINLSWNAVSNASSYTVKVDGETSYTNITDTTKTISGLSVGSHKFTVQAIGNGSTYDDSDTSDDYNFTVTEPRELSSIALSGSLNKNSYSYGESWSNSGLVVTASYTSGDPEIVTSNADWSYSPTAPTVGTTSVSITATFGEKSDTKSYEVSVGKASLSAPSPTFSATNKTITWDAVPNASSYQVKIGSGAYASATSPYDVSSYEGEGEQTFYVKAIGNSNYSDSNEASITFEVKASIEYQLISSVDDLIAGCNYVIGSASSESAVFMSTTENANNRRQTNSIAINNSKITATDEVLVLKLGGTSGAWSLHTENYLGTNGYLAAATGKSNHCRVIADATVGTITFESGKAIIDFPNSDGRTHLRYNSDANSGQLFACYSSAQSPIYMFKEVSTKQTVSLSKESVSGMKGDSNNTLSITASNFTPTNIEVSYSNANIATVTKGIINDKVIPLNVSFDNVGTTKATITVKGGKVDLTVELDITVVAKPASLTLVNSAIDDGEIYVKLNGSRQISFTAKDTDGENYAIDYSGITATSSDSSVCSLSGNANMVLNGDKLSEEEPVTITCTITATKDWTTPIQQTLKVYVINDYNVKNTSITPIDNVNVDQGDTIEVEKHIASATATTYFGTNNNPIANDELLFSYSNDRSTAVAASNFVWDVTDETLVPPATETRTVYVFVTFDETYAGTSFGVVIAAQDKPVTGLIFDSVEQENDAEIPLSLPRNSTYDLDEHITVNPANATESHLVNYSIEEGDEYVSLSDNKLIIGNLSGDTVACVLASPEAKPEFSIILWISITRESMDITYQSEISYNKITSTTDLTDGDYLIVYETGSVVFDGSRANGDSSKIDAGRNNQSVTITNSKIGSTADPYHFTITSTENGYSIKSASGFYIGVTSYANGLATNDSSAYENDISFDADGNVVIGMTFSSGTMTLRYNATAGENNERFRYYKSGQQAIQLYKKAGGTATTKATDALLDILDGAMSYNNGKYSLNLCDASGASFNDKAWSTLASKFTSTIKSDNHLATANADENGNEVEQFLAVYDYIVGKWGNDYNYLNREVSSVNSRVNPIVALNDVDNSVWVISAVALVGLTAIGGYFFYRKRKENI